MSRGKMTAGEVLAVLRLDARDAALYRSKNPDRSPQKVCASYQQDGENAIRAVSAMAVRISELEAALKPLADMAVHFPARRTYGNRPTTGEIYEVESPQAGVASITVEHLRAAAALLVSAEAE